MNKAEKILIQDRFDKFVNAVHEWVEGNKGNKVLSQSKMIEARDNFDGLVKEL